MSFYGGGYGPVVSAKVGDNAYTFCSFGGYAIDGYTLSVGYKRVVVTGDAF